MPKKTKPIEAKLDQKAVLSEYLVHLTRLGLAGRPQDVQAYARRIIKRVSEADPSLAKQLADVIGRAPNQSAPLREAGATMVPVDADSRLALLKHEYPALPEVEPLLTPELATRLDQVVSERSHSTALATAGLTPSRSLLFVGPPGVGKTLCARWLAQRLGYPLLILDLATVMSSYLGKTGTNIRAVLDYAKSIPSVLLLDEFDAVAKRRDDEGDVGELKRLVTVLLQEIDDWPPTSLLVAATNHGELLDPAVWRRFDDVLAFDVPAPDLRQQALVAAFGSSAQDVKAWIPLLLKVWEGRSFSDIARSAHWIRRRSTVSHRAPTEFILEAIEGDVRLLDRAQRQELAPVLAQLGVSERRISATTGMSRDTMRKRRRANK